MGASAVTSLCQGQIYSNIAWKFNPAGAFPASGATITICTISATGSPCSPTVTIYQDSALSIPVTNPLAVCLTNGQIGCADGLGNFSFYVTPGAYSYTVSGSGLNAYGPIPFGVSCVAGVTCVTSSGTNNFTGPCSFAATTTFNGVVDINNTMAAASAGVFTNAQMNIPFTTDLNSLNFQTEYQASQGPNFLTSGFVAGVSVPSTSTVFGAFGISAFATNASSSTNTVASYGQTRALGNNTHNWGSNFVVTDDGLRTAGLNQIAGEFDVSQLSPASAYTSIVGVTAALSSAVGSGQVTGGSAFIAGVSGNSQWPNGFTVNNGAVANGGASFTSGALCTTGTCNSLPIQWKSFNVSVAVAGAMTMDNLGNVTLSPGGAGAFKVPAPFSATTVTSTVATGTPPLAVTSTTPVANLAASPTAYVAAGTQITNAHIVSDTGFLASGTPSTLVVTLTGSAAFSLSTSYNCTVTNKTAAADSLKISYSSGSSFTITGPNTVTDGVSFICVGD